MSVATRPSYFYRRLYNALLAGFIAIVCGIVTAATWYIIQDRKSRLDLATQNTSTLARALEEHVNRAFNGVDVLIIDIANDITRAGGLKHFTESELHKELKYKKSLLQQADALFIYDAGQTLFAGSGSFPVPRIDGSKLEHVKVHVENNIPSLHLGQPLLSPVTHKSTIPVTRRINNVDGSFGGVVGAILDQDYFNRFYEQLGTSLVQGISLIRSDGIMLFRFPHTKELKPGINLTKVAPISSQDILGNPEGVMHFISNVDQIEKILAYRRIQDYGLSVAVIQNVPEILAPWYRIAMGIGTGVAIVVIALLVLLWISLRQIARRDSNEQRLVAAEEQYRSLVEMAPIGIARFIDSRIEYANPEMARIFGVDNVAEMIGHTALEYIHPEDRDYLKKRFANLQSGPVRNPPAQLRVLHADGTEFIVQGQSMSLVNDGRLVVHAMIRDITAEHLATEEIRKLNESLEQKVHDRTAELNAVNQELEAFSYSVSHDLRAPLRAIAGFADILRSEHGSEFSKDANYLFERIEDGARRMSALIEALISLSLISSHEIHASVVNLSELVRQIVNDLQQQNPQRKVEVIIEDGVSAYADPAMLEIVMRNLLANAFKYTAYTSDARIEFGQDKDTDEKAFYIKDNGVGFDMEYSQQLFRPFQRLHNAKDFEGTGIGLATVERIIRRHGGRIWVEAKPDMGAIFHFELPSGK